MSARNPQPRAGPSGDADNPVIGIDLGTTFSCVGVFQNGKVVVIPNENGNRITTSCVSFSGNNRLVGDEAKEQAAQNPENTIFEAKRLMGRTFDDEKAQEDMDNWEVTVVNDNSKPMYQVQFCGETRKFSAEEISGMILSKMKEVAERFLFGPNSNKKVTDAVITVPAYFTEVQRKATKTAARLAGLTVKKMIDEPTAAAIAYAVDYVEDEKKRNILVFDLGGGTFDVTILQIEGKNFVVKAKGGDTHLGGADFDNRLVQLFAEEIRDRFAGFNIKDDPHIVRRLKNSCEAAKIRLSSCESATIELDSLIEGEDFVSEISRSEFVSQCMDLFQDTIKPIEDVLSEADMDFKDIDDLVLVGGSTRIPKVQQMIKDMFSGKELARDIHPDEAVAYGAVIAAAMYSQGNELVQVNIKDVTPLSLGVRIKDGYVKVIIPRNKEIPIEAHHIFTTAVDNQTCVNVQVIQGERPLADDNMMIGELMLEGIPAQPAGKPRIKVTFTIDDDGNMSVFSRDLTTGVRQQLTIHSVCGIREEKINELLEQAERFRDHDQGIKERISIRNELHSLCTRKKNNRHLMTQMKTMLKWWDKHPHATKQQLEEKIGIVNKLVTMIENPDNECCVKLHECGNLCCGIANEAVCMPCLFCSRELNQKATDVCIICQDELCSTPSIQMECKHVIHADCVRDLLQKRYPGPRITFTFTQCPTCKEEISHPSLTDIIEPIDALKQEVQRKALTRLRAENQDRSPEIHAPGGRFFKNPTGFAMAKYAYYLCSKCSQPYYGGEARCAMANAVAAEEAGQDFDPNELVCGSCSSNGQVAVCQKHGADFLGYKCRYCCSMAVWFCFGTTHFCDKCHGNHGRLMNGGPYPNCPVAPGGIPAAGDRCPLRIKHGPTGQEYYLGCSICKEQNSY